jgi:hypothetical protein
MRYKVIEEMVKRKQHLDLINWNIISRCSSTEFIIKHKDDPNYLFSWVNIAENKNIDLDFVQTYMDYFAKEQVLIQLNKHILVDKKFILSDHHIKLKEEHYISDLDLTYREIYDYDYDNDNVNCSNICDNYEKFFKDYDNCPTCCIEIKNHLYKHMYITKGKYYILFYKTECFIIKKSQLNIACEIFKNNELITKCIPLGNESIMKKLSKNKSISLQEKFDTKDNINWNWKSIMYEHTSEIDKEWYYKIKEYIKEEDLVLFQSDFEKDLVLFQSDFEDLSHQFLDEILNDEKDLELLLRMVDNIRGKDKKKYYKILIDYPNKNELIDKLVKCKETYKVDVGLFTIMASIDKIKQNLHVDWNLNQVFRRKEVDLDFLKLVYYYRKDNISYFRYEIPWGVVSSRDWVTDELMLNNLDLPWNIFSERKCDGDFDGVDALISAGKWVTKK